MGALFGCSNSRLWLWWVLFAAHIVHVSSLAGQVFAVFGCFIALLVKAEPIWSQVFIGFVPDKGLFQSNPDAVYAGEFNETYHLRSED